MKIFIALISLMWFFSCEKGSDLKINNIFEVTVAGGGIDCGLILIDFEEKDKTRIEEITGTTGWLRYFGFNLDKKYNQVGQVLVVTVRKTKDEELFACTTWGPGYPWVTILTAEEKEARAQADHIFASVYAFKLELIKMKLNLNHYAMKTVLSQSEFF